MNRPRVQNMDESIRIIVTGAAGFIGSCLTGFLNKRKFENLFLVDDFTSDNKISNLAGKRFAAKIDREQLGNWLASQDRKIDFIFHMGARTDTAEADYLVHEYFNVEYSKKIWNYCSEYHVPLVYASSAATYGSGEFGYIDSHDIVNKLQPLNAYGISKNEFDKWALQQEQHPPFWVGLKFFNVYGPNEYHKGRMASVIWHSFNQVREHGVVSLFRSHRADFSDGNQLRDFIYVKDILKVCSWMMEQYYLMKQQLTTSATGSKNGISGLYNLGTGKARSFDELVKCIFSGVNKRPAIQYIDIPRDIRDKYQYYTEADISKLRMAGYTDQFYSLQTGIEDYMQNYLFTGKYY
jgi:ADP-L-glycero-D-manno-heptose 6-epimerase